MQPDKTCRELSKIDIVDEFCCSELGDERRTNRLCVIAERLGRKPGQSLPEAMGDSAGLEGAYRFFRNSKVMPSRIAGGHVAQTVQRMEAHARVMVAHDTTEFSFGGESERKGLGRLHGKKSKQGFFAHVGLCIAPGQTADPLGVLAFNAWSRAPKQKKKGKEMLRWGHGVRQVEQQLAAQTDIVHLMDREGDSYELFSELVEAQGSFVVRACHDRVLCGTAYRKLFAALQEAPFQLEREVVLSARKVARTAQARRIYPARRSRKATLAIHAIQVTMQRPEPLPKTLPATLSLNVVDVRELAPSDGGTPVHWILVTDLPIETAEEVATVVDSYRCRWVIEEYFKALKTGCRFERLQLESFDALHRALAVYVPIAWQLLRLRSLARLAPNTPASEVLEPVQLEIIRTVFLRRPKRKLTVGDALLAIAARGGHQKNNGEPGWQILSRGFNDLILLEQGWRAALGSTDQS